MPVNVEKPPGQPIFAVNLFLDKISAKWNPALGFNRREHETFGESILQRLLQPHSSASEKTFTPHRVKRPASSDFGSETPKRNPSSASYPPSSSEVQFSNQGGIEKDNRQSSLARPLQQKVTRPPSFQKPFPTDGYIPVVKNPVLLSVAGSNRQGQFSEQNQLDLSSTVQSNPSTQKSSNSTEINTFINEVKSHVDRLTDQRVYQLTDQMKERFNGFDQKSKLSVVKSLYQVMDQQRHAFAYMFRKCANLANIESFRAVNKDSGIEMNKNLLYALFVRWKEVINEELSKKAANNSKLYIPIHSMGEVEIDFRKKVALSNENQLKEAYKEYQEERTKEFGASARIYHSNHARYVDSQLKIRYQNKNVPSK